MSTFQAVGDPLLGELLARRLMTPGGALVPGVAPELFPCIVLENDRPEWHYIANAGLFGRSAAVGAGGAATRSSAQLVNARPDTLVVVERVLCTVASGNVVIRVFNYPTNVIPFGTQLVGESRDTRRRRSSGLPGQSAAVIITDNTLGTVTTAPQITEALSLNLTEPFVLGPGGALYISPDVDNVAISRVSIFWRERKANPSELL